MFHHQPLRLLAACTLLVLALSPAVGQAGTVPTVPELPPLSGRPDTAQLANLVQEAQSQPQEADPRLNVDRGLEAMGGLAGYEALRQSELAAQPAAPAAQAPQAAPLPPQEQIKAPDQPLRSHLPQAAAAPAPAATKAPAARAHVTPDLLQPKTVTKTGASVQSATVKPLYAAGSYNLSVDRDVFALGETGNVTVTLTENGAPVAGATVRVDYGGPAYTTGANGVATFAFTAPQSERIIPLLVTAANAADQPMGELYAVPKQYGVLVISDVSDQAGQPVQYFDAYVNNGWGYWGRNTDSGRIAMIVPAQINYVEVATHNWPGLFLFQTVAVPEIGKAVIHPSGTTAVRLDTELRLDGAHRDSVLFLHNENSPFDTAIGAVAANAYVTPGTYTVVNRAPGNASIPAVALLQQHVDVSSATTLQQTARTSDLARVEIQSFDGAMAPSLPQFISLKAGQTQIDLDGNASALLVQPGPYFNLVRYGYDGIAGDTEWNYQFWGEGRGFNLPAVGSTYTLSLGGPVTNRYGPWGSFQPGTELGIRPQLSTPNYDTFQAWTTPLNSSSWQQVAGTVSLIDPTLAPVYTRTIDTNTNEQRFTLPNGANGTWQLSVDFPDLGPYQAGGAHQTWSIPVRVIPHYYLSYSRTMLDPDTTTNITLTVNTDNGPGANLQLQVGNYGGYTTNANGAVSFDITTHGREEIPVSVVDTTNGWLRVGYLYVVPPGYGVVYINSVQDRNGKSADWFRFSASWFDPNGGFSLWQGGGQGGTGIVRMAGQNYLEINFSNTNNEWYYLYQPVTVQDHGWQSIDITAASAVPVTAALTMGGQTTYDFNLRLHNQAMPGWTAMDGGVPSRNLWVTPGAYTLQADTWINGSPVLLTQNADLNGTGRVDFVADPAGLATLRFHMTDSAGNQMGQSFSLWTPGFSRRMGDQPVLVTPGIPYFIHDYDWWTSDPTTNASWHYRFEHRRQDPPPVTPVPGQVVDMNMGGPLHALLQSTGTATTAGSMVTFETGLLTAGLDNVYPDQNYNDVDGFLTIDDAQGNTWYSRLVSPWENTTTVQMPAAPGNYTMRLAYETGPYQGTVAATLPLTVTTAGDPVTLTLSQNAVTVGQPADVTITATRAGQPVSGADISLFWYGSQRTGADGTVTFHVSESSSIVLQAKANLNGQVAGTAFLFALNPDEAGVEIGGTDAAGIRLSGFTGSAEVEAANGAYKYSSYNGSDLVGVIAHTGQAYVELMKEGPNAYLLNTVIDVTAGNVYRIILDGSAAVAVPFTVTYEGAALQSGVITLRSNRSVFTSYFNGLYLYSTGEGTFHVTPDSEGYTGLARGRVGSQHVAIRLGGIFPGNGGFKFALQRSQVELLQFRPMYQGQLMADGNVAIRLSAGGFQFAVAANDLLATPGIYRVDGLNILLPQSNGEQWTYETAADQRLQIDLQPGQPQSFQWVLDNVTNSVYARSYSYLAGGQLIYRLKTLLGGQWAVQRVYPQDRPWESKAPAGVHILDATGTEVYSMGQLGYGEYAWTVPAQTPSPRYTVQMNRDLGVFGAVGASAVYTLESSPQPTNVNTFKVDREMLTVGQNNVVRAMLVVGNQPVPNAWVQVQGETTQWRRTDGRGQLTVPIKPTRAGTWTFTYSTPTVYVRGAAYALAPGWGLVDMKVTDERALSLSTVYMQAVAGDYQTTGAHTGSEQTKMVVPAGDVQLVARARKSTGENYYLISKIAVPSMGQVTANVSAVLATRIDPHLAGTGTDSKVLLYLRNTAVPYLEWTPLPNALADGKPLYVTPGTYDGMVRVSDPGLYRYIPLANLPVQFGSIYDLPINAADANIPLNVTATGGNGQTGLNAELQLASDSAMSFVPLDGSQVMVALGQYEILGGSLDLVDPSLNLRYRYLFHGHVSLPVWTAQPVEFVLGGPLTANLQVEQQQVPVNGAVSVHAAAQTASGLSLFYTEAYSNATGDPAGWLLNQLTVSNNGYSRSYSYLGDTVTAAVGPLSGTYNLHFSAFTGPYGSNPNVDATGTIQAMRLIPRRP